MPAEILQRLTYWPGPAGARAGLVVKNPRNNNTLGPGHHDTIGLEAIVMRHNRQALDLRLRDQHAVEGITVVLRERGQAFCVFERDGKRLKAADLDAECKRHFEPELAKADLNR